jgi:(p)ppGpp synthase/HD superfamily hydrolase
MTHGFGPITRDGALAIARLAHHGQLDKAGVPYIFHPVSVAKKAVCYLPPEMYENAEVVALLHDVVEDTPVTFEQLVAAGVTPTQNQALHALTKFPQEPKLEHAERCVKAGLLAAAVKLADVRHNLERMASLPAEDQDRLRPRYETSERLLTGAVVALGGRP